VPGCTSVALNGTLATHVWLVDEGEVALFPLPPHAAADTDAASPRSSARREGYIRSVDIQ
jgi:hypothetical protein